MNKLGTFVKNKRKDLAMTQKDFALKLKISDVTLSNIENGYQVGSLVIRKLSNYFNVSTKVIREMMLFKEGMNESNKQT